MARILTAISRALHRDAYQEPPVHFHSSLGQPEVCHDEACARPHLRVD